MSWGGDVFGFENSKLSNMWGKAKSHPEQLLLGGADPFGAKIAGGITGKEYSPLVDQWGGATGDDYSKAQAEGVNTGPGKTMHGIARVVAALMTAKYAGGKMGGGAGGTEGGGMQMPSGMQMSGQQQQQQEDPMLQQQLEQRRQEEERRQQLAEALARQQMGNYYG